MKKLNLTFILLLFAIANCVSQAHTFVHPGIPWTLNDLDQMKTNRTVSPWSVGWNQIINSSEASLNYSMQGPAVNVDRNDNNITNDGNAALYHALQWYFTGSVANAQKAVIILEAWAANHKTFSGNAVHLHAAWRGGTLVKAAEILRYTYSGWTEANTTNCENYFQSVLWPQFRLPNPLRAANQGANNLWGAIQVAIFCNDQTKFAQCIDAYLNDDCAGIRNSLPNGQVGDSGRDQGHAGGMIGNLVSVAEIAWSQGVDLYGTLDNRLLAASEYWCKYNSGEEVDFIDHGTCYDYFTSIGADNRDTNSPHFVGMLEKIVGAYVVRKGLLAPYSTDYLNGINSDQDTFFFRKDAAYNSTATPSNLTDEEFTYNNVTTLASADLGTVGQTGSSSYNNGTWTVTGSGSDVSGDVSNDSFHYAFKQISGGDGAFIAKVESIQNTDPNAKAGIVFRASLASNSKMAIVSPRADNGYQFSSRGFEAADGSGTLTVDPSSLPIWVKIERRGNNVYGYVGPDGVSWSTMENTIFTTTGDYFIGLGVTSHNNNLLSTATFTNVQVTPGAFTPTDVVIPDPLPSFVPDPNKTYYMDVLKHPLRVGATGESNDLFTTSTNTTGPDVEWRFISDGNDAWFIERAAGGSLARLRSDNTEFADMENPNSTGNESWETFSFTDGESFGTSLLTTEGPSSLRRLQVTPTQFGGDVKFLTIASTGSWESFTFTEAGSFLSTKDNTIIGLKIYPNPVTNKVTINGAINSNIKVFDINGKAIFTKAIDRESEILDLSILSPGFYYAEVIKADRRSVIKLVKN